MGYRWNIKIESGGSSCKYITSCMPIRLEEESTKLSAFTNWDLLLMVVTFLLGCPVHISFSHLSREVCVGNSCAGEGQLWKYHLLNLSFSPAPLWIHWLTWAGKTTRFALESAILSSSAVWSPTGLNSRWQRRRDPNSVPIIQLCSDAVLKMGCSVGSKGVLHPNFSKPITRKEDVFHVLSCSLPPSTPTQLCSQWLVFAWWEGRGRRGWRKGGACKTQT